VEGLLETGIVEGKMAAVVAVAVNTQKGAFEVSVGLGTVRIRNSSSGVEDIALGSVAVVVCKVLAHKLGILVSNLVHSSAVLAGQMMADVGMAFHKDSSCLDSLLDLGSVGSGTDKVPRILVAEFAAFEFL